MVKHIITRRTIFYLAVQDGRYDDREFDTEAEAVEAWRKLADNQSVCIMSDTKNVSVVTVNNDPPKIDPPKREAIVINLVGGPGSGKSTIAADLFARMKWQNINVELVSEYAKDLVWEERHVTFKDQLYLFAKQNHKLERLRKKVDFIINDSPLLLVLIYKPEEYYIPFETFVRSVWNSYNNLNFEVLREKPYHPVGRNQTEEQAKQLDMRINNLFSDQPYTYRVPGNIEAAPSILGIIQRNIKNDAY